MEREVVSKVTFTSGPKGVEVELRISGRVAARLAKDFDVSFDRSYEIQVPEHLEDLSSLSEESKRLTVRFVKVEPPARRK